MTPAERDRACMEAALEEARRAARGGDVPVGAVVVADGAVIARGRNRREERGDPLAHAEMEALREAAVELGRWRLDGCTLYCTLEPCPMCAGAIVQARLPRLVYGAADPRAGAAGTLYDIPRDSRLAHRCRVAGGVMAPECRQLLQAFFAQRRRQRG